MVKDYSKLEKEDLLKDMDHPTYIASDKTIREYKKALKEEDKAIEVKNISSKDFR